MKPEAGGGVVELPIHKKSDMWVTWTRYMQLAVVVGVSLVRLKP